jgi:hypothetical protein
MEKNEKMVKENLKNASPEKDSSKLSDDNIKKKVNDSCYNIID